MVLPTVPIADCESTQDPIQSSSYRIIQTFLALTQAGFVLYSALRTARRIEDCRFLPRETEASMGCIFELVREQQTHSVSSTQTVLDVARIMVENNIGAVPVVSEGALVGIFSERDLMKRVEIGRAHV